MDASGIVVERRGDRCFIRVTGKLTPQTVTELRALTLQARHTEVDATAARVPEEAEELLHQWRAQDRRLTLHLSLRPGSGGEGDDALPVEVPDLLAHELRSPLTVAHLRLQTLSTLLAGKGLPEEADACRAILGSLEHLSGLLDTYLAASGPWNFSRVDLRELCAKLAEGPCEQLGLGAVQVVADASVWVRGEPRALTQAIWNILRNGLEAGAPAGPVTVRVGALSAEGMAEVLIQDSGPGFPARVIAAPFSLYHSTKPRGMGIGLPICRWILQRHGGALELENTDHGGQVRVLLPAVSPPSESR